MKAYGGFFRAPINHVVTDHNLVYGQPIEDDTRRELPRTGLRIHQVSHGDLADRIRPRVPVRSGRALRGLRDLGRPTRPGVDSRIEWTAAGDDGFPYGPLVLNPGRRPRKQTRGGRKAGVMIGSPMAPKGVFGPVIKRFRSFRLRQIADRELAAATRRSEA
jgi:hypothetical protein